MRLTIDALQANDGDCLLLHYARTGAPTLRILVDGGSRGIYRQVLRPRIDQLRHGGSPRPAHGARQPHRRWITSPASSICSATWSACRTTAASAFCRIRTLWHNAFEKVHAGRRATVQSAAVGAALGGAAPAGLNGQAAAVVASVPSGRRTPRRRRTPGHRPSTRARWRISCGRRKAASASSPSHRDCRLTILGPHDAQLQKLDAEWRRSEQAHPAESRGTGRRLPEQDRAEPLEHRAAARSGARRRRVAGARAADRRRRRRPHPRIARQDRRRPRRAHSRGSPEGAAPRQQPQHHAGLLRTGHRRPLHHLGQRQARHPAPSTRSSGSRQHAEVSRIRST